jgi:predicted porin
MNKKVMALAVAGALAAPVSALAQTTIYGQFNVEYGAYSPGNNTAGQPQNNADSFNSGASRLGFRGEEKLGGTMSAWYQCESDVRFLDETTANGSWCDRNSAIGLKGAYGNVFFGTWDSPLKTATGTTRITNEGGWLGTQGVLITDFSNRNKQTINYSTPNLGGFTANAQVSNTQQAVDTPETNSAADGRIMAIGGQYAAGPLVVVAALEQRKKVKATLSGGGANAKDEAWAIGATYVFGPIKAGLTYVSISLDDGLGVAGSKIDRKSYGLAGTYTTGPHVITLGYTIADDLDISGGIDGSGTAGNQLVVSYNYYLSKRTNVGIGYSKVDNDSNNLGGNTALYNLDNRAAICNGCSSSVVSVNLTHSF